LEYQTYWSKQNWFTIPQPMDVFAMVYNCKEHLDVIHLNVPHVDSNAMFIHKRFGYISNGLAILTLLEHKVKHTYQV